MDYYSPVIRQVFHRFLEMLNQPRGYKVLMQEARVCQRHRRLETPRFGFVDAFLSHHGDTPGSVHMLIHVLLKLIQLLVSYQTTHDRPCSSFVGRRNQPQPTVNRVQG